MEVLHGDSIFHLSQIANASVQLVYLDPPFFTQKTHSLRTRDNSTEYAFEDRWESLAEYLSFIRQVLTQSKRVLKDSGTLFFHCDKSASHHLRLLLDEVFGGANFQSEIIWSYKRWSNSKKGLLNAHQTIYFYSKTDEFKFNTIYSDYSPTTNVDQILQARARNEFGKSVYRRDRNGDVIASGEKKGVPLSDVWNIPFLNPKANERVGYPTQKPVLLLERIIEIATDKHDCVLDPFCGSGTTLVAAHILERNYIGIDASEEAVKLSKARLLEPTKTESYLLKVGEGGFLEKPESERRILRALDAVPVERNSGIDGFLKLQVDSRPISVRIQKDGEDIETTKQKLITASASKNCGLMILIRTQHIATGSLFGMSWDNENLLVIDAYDLSIDDWIKEHRLLRTNAEMETSNS